MDIDKDLQDALLKCAVGYEYKEEKVIADKNKKTTRIEVVRKHVRPDPAAIRRAQELRELGLWIEDKDK